jgi:hypothetical protein
MLRAQRTRLHERCSNDHKRPLDEVEGEIIEEIQKRVLSESSWLPFSGKPVFG